MSIEEFGYKDQLHRALTTKDLVIYGMIFMVPIAPYSVFGFVYSDAKGMVPLGQLNLTTEVENFPSWPSGDLREYLKTALTAERQPYWVQEGGKQPNHGGAAAILDAERPALDDKSGICLFAKQ